MYGNYNFWSWFRYWYVDSCNLVTMILLDKGYFDYDAQKAEKPVVWEDTVKSDEEVADMLAMFGIGQKRPETEEDIQKHILNQMEEK